MDHERLSEYRIMWVMVYFDLPTTTPKERKRYSLFRKGLLEDGFTMFQYSIYIRHCGSRENAEVHIARVRNIVPPHGYVVITMITDKQFGMMEVLVGDRDRDQDLKSIPNQLELF